MDRVENGITIFASFLFILTTLKFPIQFIWAVCVCLFVCWKREIHWQNGEREIKSNVFLLFNCDRINRIYWNYISNFCVDFVGEHKSLLNVSMISLLAISLVRLYNNIFSICFLLKPNFLTTSILFVSSSFASEAIYVHTYIMNDYNQSQYWNWTPSNSRFGIWFI